MRAEAVCELADALDRLVAALADDVGCAELLCEGDPVGVPAEDDDPLRAETAGGDHAAQPDRAVADDGSSLQSLLAEDATSVRPRERCDDDVADLEIADVRADDLDDADELVPHALAGLAGRHLVVGPEVAAADAGPGDADEGVGRFDDVDPGTARPPQPRRCRVTLVLWTPGARSESS